MENRDTIEQAVSQEEPKKWKEIWQLPKDKLEMILDKLPEKGKILDLGCREGILIEQL